MVACRNCEFRLSPFTQHAVALSAAPFMFRGKKAEEFFRSMSLLQKANLSISVCRVVGKATHILQHHDVLNVPQTSSMVKSDRAAWWHW